MVNTFTVSGAWERDMMLLQPQVGQTTF